MPRRMRKLADVQERFATDAGASGRRRTQDRHGGLHKMEVLAAVCKYFCEGHTASEIKRLLAERHQVEMSREEPYQLIAYAASQGWMRFVAPHEHALREQIKKRYRWLQDVDVVHTSVFDDVGFHGAEMLVELAQRHHMPPYGKNEVHIGFAGGHAMRKLAQAFAQLLRQPTEGLPGTIVLHAMVAGFDVYEPTTDPNAFFTYFVRDPAMQVETRFVGLHAPAVVKAEQFRSLRELEGIRETYARAEELDIIVTSASLWTDPHCLLRQYMEKAPKAMPALQREECVGDMLWRPLGRKGPIEVETAIRAMTLMELSSLPAFIQRGKHVLLVLGPCVGCNRPKTEMLEVVLNLHPPLITHLVVDSRSARGILGTG